MSGPIQVGDIFTIAKIVNTLFEYGWKQRRSSSRNYNEFGQDVDTLRYNLDLLVAVIESADSKLHDLTRSRTASVKWDPRSFGQIIGDCWQTVHECEKLLYDNSSYAVDAGPLRNIRWNLMVQEDVDALQVRIRQHTNKLQLALAPFEIDLLTSIQRSIHEMHIDLRDQILQVHQGMLDVRRDVQQVLELHGIVVPELQQGLDRQEAQAPLLVVPVAIRDQIDRIYNKTTTKDPSLADLADAFVAHFYESTCSFQPVSRIARDKVPPDKAYLNLMKCIWLIEKVKENEEFRNVPEGSHWTSYVAELEKVLSDECRRFESDLVTPAQPILSDENLRIWRKENRSSTVIIPREAEVVLSTRVTQRTDDGEQDLKLQLLRYLDDANGQEFTINMYRESDASPVGDSLDFNLKTAVLIPRYVVGDLTTGPPRLSDPPRPRGMWSSRMFQRVEDERPPSSLASNSQGAFKMTLGRGRRFETFNFKRLSQALAFQHAITGYFVQGSKSFSANVTFVHPNQGPRPSKHKAYVQVWYPLRKEADLPATAGLFAASTSPTAFMSGSQLATSPRSSITAFNVHRRGGISPDLHEPFGRERRDTRDTTRSWADRGPNRQTSLSTISPTEVGRSPPRLGPLNFGGRGFEPYSNPEDIPPPRVPQGAQYRFGERRPSISEQSQASSRRTSIFSAMRSKTRSSVSSAWTEQSSNSSSGSNSTIGVDTGGGIIGTLHTPPPKPMIVMLIENQETGERSIVTLDLPSSEIRPDLCDCRRSGAQGRSCRDVCLEVNRQGPGTAARRPFLQARILKPVTTQSGAEWDLSRLAYTRRDDDSVNSSPLDNLNRVTISFDLPSDRVAFCGDVFCGCVNRGKAGLETDRQRRDCVNGNHRGIVGQAKEYYYEELRAYELAAASRTHVVNQPRPSD